MVGYVSKSGCTFDDLKSIVGAQFCRLPLYEDSESDMTDERLASWAEQLKGEMLTLS